MININTLNQNNGYSLGKPNITTVFSTLAMGETTTTSGNMGKLIPIFFKELQPSQTINSQQAINIQFTPFVTNLMHQIKGELISYFIPYRLIWDDWEDFVTGGKDGTKLPVMPTVSIESILEEYCNNTTRKGLLADEITKGIKILKKRIADYHTQGKTHEETAAKLAVDWGNCAIEKIYNASGGDETFLNNTEDQWDKATQALENGYPYFGPTSNRVDLLAHEMLVYENVIQFIFQGTQWDYLGLPFALAHFVYFIFKKCSDVQTLAIYEVLRERGNKAIDIKVMALPFRAYRKVYNDWIRLADWEDEISITEDNTAAVTIEDANYDWDYFTRARRYQIRGAMPTIPVLGGQQFYDTLNPNVEHSYLELGKDASGDPVFKILGNEFKHLSISQTNRQNPESIKHPSEQIEFTDVMTAAALMNYFAANARIRPRYAEHLLARWNVRIQDARLQLSEFIGINEINITSQGVVQTSAGTSEQTQQGNITGQLWGNGSNMHIGYKAQEHGIVITFLVIKPANSYEQGYPAWMKKRTRFDLPTPEMVNLPDIAIMSNEIDPFAPETEIVGYKAIYDEYRTSINKVTGLLRPSNSVGLASYTLARKINKPTIEKIVKCRPNLSRIKQYLNQPDFILITAISTTTAIPLPYTSDVRLSI